MKTRAKIVVAVLAGFVALSTATAVLAYASPGRPTGLVNDFAKVLSADQKYALEVKVGNFARPAGVQLAIVTVPTLGDETIEAYAVKLFEEWGIGQKLKDNGLLVLVAPNEREVRVEVGYGLEPTVTDAMASVIINSVMIPRFKAGDYYGGIDTGVDSLIKLVEGDPEYTAYVKGAAIGAERDSGQSGSHELALWEVVALIVIFIIVVSTRTGRRILVYMLINGLFNGRGRGGGSGGGFGGFGGGRSGGGGASGRW